MTSAGRAVGDRGTAVVIGGGLAGCLAAWALRGVAQRVVVIERDRYPEGADFRAGVPQGRHGHLLLEAGHRTLEELMPGARADLFVAGATRVPVSGALRWLSAAGWLAEYEAELAFMSCTRPVIDKVVLDRVRTEPSIEILEGTEVVGLLGDARTVTGVRIRERGRVGAEVQHVPAELVVDAAGRGTRISRWLEDLGAQELQEERVDAGVAYASRIYYRTPGHNLGFDAFYVQTQAPVHGRLGVLLPVEGDRWIVSMGGMRGHEPSIQAGEFEQQLAALRDPGIADVVTQARPAGPPRGFLPGPGVWRHHERTAPDGLVAVGDASCTFNPVYGQGMSVAALGARALRDIVRRHQHIGPAAARDARDAIAAVTKNPWVMSSSEDVRFPATTGGPTGRMVRTQHRFLDRVLARATTDPKVTEAFHTVSSLVEPPTALFRPSVLGAVLFGG
ncbi:FAD-dependent oxidoreductase [Kitasatospora sp. NPDC049285]|uniref:NAD(P)/FAD-dependent oxidoreductase n=1 Tax=Kitasatospora sp. NPDC049285 TaxID=3157096 RepID=UPI003429E520